MENMGDAAAFLMFGHQQLRRQLPEPVSTILDLPFKFLIRLCEGFPQPFAFADVHQRAQKVCALTQFQGKGTHKHGCNCPRFSPKLNLYFIEPALLAEQCYSPIAIFRVGPQPHTQHSVSNGFRLRVPD